ncbi:transcriptional regulator [Sporosarcina sp. P13]|uniref:winged helix-turn-helix transcriptional regulator n=1 Tax=Sporosarcina sp. P13 TaxID=2048263 RepID=UPI000C170D6C|nr:winged helix-turn-helix transcriptional regulator [Sporosarcina sp. P13]PIC63982.1 transcriptional regulator [Sporosarcina sp. P13]
MEIEYKDKTYFTSKDLALSVIGGRWKIALIWCLLQKSPLRLSEIEKKLPDANQRMLIRQLRELEEDKIVTRLVYPVVPPKVEYQLSEIGLLLEPVVTSICDWGEQFSATLEQETSNTERELIN